jgi:membrane peptidoglycan carboxypeptidase
VPQTAQAITVRDFVLDQMLESDFITREEYDQALVEEVVLAAPRDNTYLAPHFVFAVRREAGQLLDGEELLDTGGLRVVTTLDYEGYQASAEKWAQVAYDMDRMTDDELRAKYGEAAQAQREQAHVVVRGHAEPGGRPSLLDLRLDHGAQRLLLQVLPLRHDVGLRLAVPLP